MAPQPGPGFCDLCFNLIGADATHCRACSLQPNHLDALVPISYSLSGGPLHMVLRAYKRDADPFVSQAVGELASILERFLGHHERCLGNGLPFDVVTTVPSGDPYGDQLHPLRRIVAELVPSLAGRHRRLLERSSVRVAPRTFHAGRFSARERLAGESVLLIDDTWATGASAQSAAAALRGAGAGRVAAVVVGRHLNRAWPDNLRRLGALQLDFDWAACALCAPPRIQAGAA
ncbi:MAG: hypothetical protein ACRDKL_08790 [Solirubrobacteraceae bacterium]